jgi:hypothetical protein
VKYQLYKELFELKKKALVVPSNCSPQEPDFLLSSKNWTLRWLLLFDDNHYMRIQEHYRVSSVQSPSARIGFSMHYGLATNVDEVREHKYTADDSVVIRIDTYPRPIHMHLGSRDPHLGQERVDGLVMENISCFDFIEKIFEHRLNDISVQDAFGFRII